VYANSFIGRYRLTALVFTAAAAARLVVLLTAAVSVTVLVSATASKIFGSRFSLCHQFHVKKSGL
jgi:hypothetical protein